MEVKVLSNLKHDGFLYRAGETVELPDDVAKSLAKDNVVERVKKVEKSAAPKITEAPKPKSLSKMNSAELKEIAGKEGVEVTEEMTNSEIIEAIKAAREAK